MPTQLPAARAPKVLYIVDLSSYVLRAYHAISELTSPSGEPTHAVHGMVNMLERLIRERGPTLLAIAMDSGRKTFRTALYQDYKANRPPAPEDLRQQIKRCEQIVRAYGLTVFKQDGVEADDLIATAVTKAQAHGLGVVIIGADKDLMQLVDENVMLYDTMRDRVFGPEEVEARFGVKVEQLGDLLALMGDTSDNIPGVPSVGPKTARDLLNEHGTLQGIYEHLDEIQRKKLRETLIEHREQAKLSRQLVALKRDCEIAFNLEELTPGPKNLPELRELFQELGFTRQLASLEQSAEGPVVQEPEIPDLSRVKTRSVTNLQELAQYLKEIGTPNSLGFYVVPRSPETHREPAVGLGLSSAEQACYVPLQHRYLGAPPPFDLAQLSATLAPLFSHHATLRVHGAKRALFELERLGLKNASIGHDSELASYLLEPDAQHELEPVAKRELSLELPSFEPVVKPSRGRRLDLDEVLVADVSERAALRAFAVQSVAERQVQRLQEQGLWDLYCSVERPLTMVLGDLERRGVLIDPERLHRLGQTCEEELKVLEQRAHEVAGKEFNVHSPRQLEALLFDEVGLKPIKRTKTSRSTDAQTLEALAESHPLPKIILEIRQLAKLKSTYIDALPQLINKQTGRVHCDWRQTTAATGRLSCTDPNLQNIPIRTELGREIRAAFIAPTGSVLLSADYSQIELRVLAHLSEDPLLLDAFQNDQDVHTRTAMEIFRVSQERVTREERNKAKAVNFGVIYGQGDSGLAKALGISRQEAGDFIAAYFRRYQRVQRFMQETLERARAGETVRTILNRRRLVPDIKSGNRARRLAAERIAMNMPIQGSAADILKLAMLKLSEPVTPGTRMIMTVHDELVFEVPENEVETAAPLIRQAMESAYPLAVPLVATVGHGRDWREAH